LYCPDPKSENGCKNRKRSHCIDRSIENSNAQGLLFQWDADTAVMTSFLKDNDGYGYFLFAIDVFSKYSWAVALKSTKGNEMVRALTSVFSMTTPPKNLRTD
jgi:hypothetical protein